MNRATSIFAVFCLCVAVVATACERKPEELDVWRSSEGGFEKLQEWAGSADEPMPVRIRATQILIEEGQVNILQPLFESIPDEATRKAIVQGVASTVDTMWSAQDQPALSKEVKEGGGRIQVGASKTVIAKDAAFFLHPFADAAEKAKFEGIMAEWMSKDQDLRTQLGSTTLGQLAPRAGEGGQKSMQLWLKETKKPAAVQRSILRDSDTPEVRGALATVLVERALADHPELSNELEVAILENDHANLTPYLEKALRDPNTPLKLKDGLMDVMVRAKGAKATPFFADLVVKQTGLLRWVSAQRLIEVRGKSGVLVAFKAFPLDAGVYQDEDWEKESEITCNFISTEMPKLGVDDIDSVLKSGLASDRWPTQVLSLRCIEVMKAKTLKGDVEALASSKTPIPHWGEDSKMTVGKLASKVAETL